MCFSVYMFFSLLLDPVGKNIFFKGFDSSPLILQDSAAARIATMFILAAA